ncbi:hypothetical protein AB205_0219650, partial [Aquarana catesbeiana]
VLEGASLAMSLKDQRDNTLGRVKDLDTDKYFHLVSYLIIFSLFGKL